MIPVLVMGLLMATLPAVAQASEARLWIVTPAPAGDLSDCPHRAAGAVLAQSADARLLTSDAVVRWEGGRFPLRGETGDDERLEQLSDHCFALVTDGKVVVSGATLRPYSARLLRFPVLQVVTRRQGEPLEFDLTPAFPAVRSQSAPSAWHEAFSGLR